MYMLKEFGKVGGIIVAIILFITLLSFTVGTRGLADLKANAPSYLEGQGFNVVGYQGYQHSIIMGPFVWYTMTKDDIVYECAVIEWQGEYQLYELKAINAVTNER